MLILGKFMVPRNQNGWLPWELRHWGVSAHALWYNTRGVGAHGIGFRVPKEERRNKNNSLKKWVSHQGTKTETFPGGRSGVRNLVDQRDAIFYLSQIKILWILCPGTWRELCRNLWQKMERPWTGAVFSFRSVIPRKYLLFRDVGPGLIFCWFSSPW